MEEGSVSLELKLLRGKDIGGFNFFQKLNVYAVASISSDDPDRKLDPVQRHRTPADKDGDGSPEWNHNLRLDLKGIEYRDSDDVFLRLDLFHEGVMFGDKHIGEVRVPLPELMEQADGVARFVSYQVKGIDGKPNGVLSFSYKVNGAGKSSGIAPIDSMSGIAGFPILASSYMGSALYPALGDDAVPFAPPLEVQYQLPEAYYPPPPESYYPPPLESYYPPPPQPPPPQPPSMLYPQVELPGAGHYPPGPLPGPPLHHHQSWGHVHGHVHHGPRPHMGGSGGGWGGFEETETWRTSSWNGR